MSGKPRVHDGGRPTKRPQRLEALRATETDKLLYRSVWVDLGHESPASVHHEEFTLCIHSNACGTDETLVRECLDIAGAGNHGEVVAVKAGLAEVRARCRTLRNARPERKHATHHEKSPLESHSHHQLL